MNLNKYGTYVRNEKSTGSDVEKMYSFFFYHHNCKTLAFRLLIIQIWINQGMNNAEIEKRKSYFKVHVHFLIRGSSGMCAGRVKLWVAYEHGVISAYRKIHIATGWKYSWEWWWLWCYYWVGLAGWWWQQNTNYKM